MNADRMALRALIVAALVIHGWLLAGLRIDVDRLKLRLDRIEGRQ